MQKVDQQLKSMLSEMEVVNYHPDIMTNRMNDILKKTATECGPTWQCQPKKRQGDRWDALVKPVAKAAKLAHWIWKTEGCPGKDNTPALIPKQTTQELWGAQRLLEADSRNNLHADIMPAATHNKDEMYRLIGQHRLGSTD